LKDKEGSLNDDDIEHLLKAVANRAIIALLIDICSVNPARIGRVA
jgi:hypothetical protein